MWFAKAGHFAFGGGAATVARMSSVVGFRQAQWRHTFLLAICVGVIGCVKTAQDSKTANADPWARVPGILKRMVPPRFPDRDFLVTEGRIAVKM